VDVDAESAGKLVRCPYCSCEFFASAEQSHLEVVDDTPADQNPLDTEHAFDKLRIKNLTALRMGAIRARSWWLIGMLLATVLAVELLCKAIDFVRAFHRWGWIPTLEIVVSILAIACARHAMRRAAEFKKEIDRSAIVEPSDPPDFSTLSDGSDRWKNLEDIR
jgi:hypothetical protein